MKKKSKIKDLKYINKKAYFDERGGFVKIYEKDFFAKEEIIFDIYELYYSISNKNVVRGMHLQLPPYEHSKIVFCQQGSIVDVFIDLRKDSASYGIHESVRLNGQTKFFVYLPPGVAHGFLSLEDNSILGYLTSSSYKEEYDTGIKWDSFGFDWGLRNPIVSKRDNSLTEFNLFTY